MSNKTEVLMCPTCGVETHHVVVLVRKKSGFEGDKKSQQERVHRWLSQKCSVRRLPCFYG